MDPRWTLLIYPILGIAAGMVSAIAGYVCFLILAAIGMPDPAAAGAAWLCFSGAIFGLAMAWQRCFGGGNG